MLLFLHLKTKCCCFLHLKTKCCCCLHLNTKCCFLHLKTKWCCFLHLKTKCCFLHLKTKCCCFLHLKTKQFHPYPLKAPHYCLFYKSKNKIVPSLSPKTSPPHCGLGCGPVLSLPWVVVQRGGRRPFLRQIHSPWGAKSSCPTTHCSSNLFFFLEKKKIQK